MPIIKLMMLPSAKIVKPINNAKKNIFVSRLLPVFLVNYRIIEVRVQNTHLIYLKSVQQLPAVTICVN